ncbi:MULTISPECIES: hypothetical protein [Sphingobacterium]|uniref:Uncharacterized protein n=1 Tax=Sphingobacterium populi TaxID=1812824 RepID=A0ABW5U9A8_9SPHI|nr:hypothetical protein [Sphingobacterium sp. CFCC 11742]
MLQINVNEQSRKAVILYPKEMRIPSKEINVSSWVDVERKWQSEVHSFIYNSLRSWTIQRNKAYKATKELNGQRAAAVDKILLMLINSQSAKLHVLCKRVVDNLEFFLLLIPKNGSSQFEYAHKIIGPMLMWCKEYKDAINKTHN